MGQAYVCDRCRDVFDEPDVKVGVLNLFSEDQTITLCDDCANKLDEWLNPEATEQIKKYLKGSDSRGNKAKAPANTSNDVKERKTEGDGK